MLSFGLLVGDGAGTSSTTNGPPLELPLSTELPHPAVAAVLVWPIEIWARVEQVIPADSNWIEVEVESGAEGIVFTVRPQPADKFTPTTFKI